MPQIIAGSLYRYIAGPSEVKFYQRLFMTPETTPLDTDTPDVVAAKLQAQLTMFEDIAQGMKQPWFIGLEELLLNQVLRIDSQEIWEAIETLDAVRQRTLAVRRTGLVALFEAMHGIEGKMETLRKQLNDIEAGVDPRAEINEELDGS